MKTMFRASEASPRPRTIGKLAKEAKVNVETIRLYERRGLLRPPKTPATGWRVYDDSAVWAAESPFALPCKEPIRTRSG